MKSITLLGYLGILMLPSIVMAQTDASTDRMQWFREARFGMFVHFGGSTNNEKFNPGDFDAKEWVRIAKAGGMKYIVYSLR